MAVAHMVTPTIRRSPPARQVDMDVTEENAPGRDWPAIIFRTTLEQFDGAFIEVPVLECLRGRPQAIAGISRPVHRRCWQSGLFPA